MYYTYTYEFVYFLYIPLSIITRIQNMLPLLLFHNILVHVHIIIA